MDQSDILRARCRADTLGPSVSAAFYLVHQVLLVPPSSSPLGSSLSSDAASGGPTSPRKGPPKFKQRATRQFKSKPPKAGVKGFGDDIPGMEGLGTDITVICPWEAFSHLELHELAQYGIV
ncbi:retinal cone rhodopsin-sensitive cGMP 3',5'-cyclic phosphodiesterase subunit gamma-like [Pristis pectinata]|uniref:retinal cone rhodopsin-sensitive cGMP 3',5'-cyclic phosphodiesterase subunit gamma-like n=1 Tax=Pristis pectinata TaxID=685728 RepID=UPI00223D426E|nr:retinal cone rhodopsin-sensitive cGMP 3',5'-cyclic phosphodiesterase subunit gamma-like [Pristis pectinata]